MGRVRTWSMLFFFVAAVTLAGEPLAPQPLKEWTVMVFLNADNNLDSAGLDDMNEMEKVGSTADVNIVALFDRLYGWQTTRRYFVQKDTKPSEITSPFEEMGELDLGNKQTVLEYVRWVKANFPARHYLISFWNHGSGWDKPSRHPMSGLSLVTYGISYDDTSGTHLSVMDVGEIMRTLKAEEPTGRNFDVVGFDACLMAMGEVYYEFHDTVDYAVGSEETEPGDGWPYDDFLGKLTANPAMVPADLSKTMVKDYAASYSGGSQGSVSVTQSAVALAALPKLAEKLDAVAGWMEARLLAHYNAIKQAQSQAKSYAVPQNKDLGHVLKLLQAGIPNAEFGALIDGALAALNGPEGCVIASAFTGSMANSTGLAIWLPSSYRSLYDQLRWSKEGHWDEFLKIFTDPPLPRLTLGTAVVTDANGNGVVEPGETCRVVLKAKNTGKAVATGIKGTLSVSSYYNYVQILQADATWPDLAIGEEAANLTEMVFKANDNVVPPKTVTLKVTTTLPAGTSWYTTFRVTIQKPATTP